MRKILSTRKGVKTIYLTRNALMSSSVFPPLGFQALHSPDFPSASVITPSQFLLFFLFSQISYHCSEPGPHPWSFHFLIDTRSLEIVSQGFKPSIYWNLPNVSSAHSFELLTSISNCLLNLSTWVSNSHLELSMPWINLWSSTHNPAPWAVFPSYLMATSSFDFYQ